MVYEFWFLLHVFIKYLTIDNSIPILNHYDFSPIFSKLLRCKMNFAIYLPSSSEDKSLPCIYYLSGLTCTEENAILKSGVQRYCAEYNVIMVFPDTSPSKYESGCHRRSNQVALAKSLKASGLTSTKSLYLSYVNIIIILKLLERFSIMELEKILESFW